MSYACIRASDVYLSNPPCVCAYRSITANISYANVLSNEHIHSTEKQRYMLKGKKFFPNRL